MKSSTKPYTEETFRKHGTLNEYVIRTFSENVDNDELVWHRDKESRRVHILQGSNWQLQIDDSLPEDLKVGHDYWIPGMVYHRLLKGEGDLIVRIEKI